MTYKTNSDSFQKVVHSAAQQLVKYELISDSFYITTPLMYSSGAYVIIRVESIGADYIVSDFGAGFEEAQMIGGDVTYRHVAKNIADACGIQFDSFSFLALRISGGQLAGAIATIANASQEAVNTTSLKVAEQKHQDRNEILYKHLVRVFSSSSVDRDAHIAGASNTEWHISSLVSVQGHKVAFEAVSKNRNSVVHAAAKFGDLARVDQAPGRVAVVSNKKSLGTLLGVLSHTASVIERSADDEVYRHLLLSAA